MIKPPKKPNGCGIVCERADGRRDGRVPVI
jgi:hypothetical protein